MIDMHAHILPGIDDGAKDTKETLLMLKEAREAGFTDVLATSHYVEGKYEFNKVDREYIINAITKKIEEENINIKIHVGAEGYITNNLPELIEKKVIPTLANSRYILFELPMRAKIMNVEDIIIRIHELGLIPIIAHPERYEIVKDNPNIVARWIELGALMQSNYGSILNAYGNKNKETLLKLLNADAVHFLGTDTHYKGGFYTQMNTIKSLLIKEIGEEKLDVLSYKNPKKVLENEVIEVNEPKKINKKSRPFWLKAIKNVEGT